MNRNMILKTDVLDIIFEKRNKSYGAYTLRKFYPNRLKMAMGLMLATAVAFSAFTFIPEKDKKVSAKPYTVIETELAKLQEKPKEPEVKKEVVKAEQKPAVKPTPVNQKQYTSVIKVVPNTVKTDTVANLLPTDVIGSTTIVNPVAGVPEVKPVKTEPGDGGMVTTTPKIDKTTPRDGGEVDVLPAYPGGMDALRKFLQKHLETPDELENGQAVSVRVKFVVDYSGKLKGFTTVQDGGNAFNNEVVRVLKKMPDWIPGKTRGESVSVYYVIPVKFESTE